MFSSARDLPFRMSESIGIDIDVQFWTNLVKSTLSHFTCCSHLLLYFIFQIHRSVELRLALHLLSWIRKGISVQMANERRVLASNKRCHVLKNTDLSHYPGTRARVLLQRDGYCNNGPNSDVVAFATEQFLYVQSHCLLPLIKFSQCP